eukprot:1161864-Pelagomonas_calceolata.AAC.7
MSRTKKGHSAGEYRSSLQHGVRNKFQASWLQEEERHWWLEDYGMDVDGTEVDEFKAGTSSACSCTRCYTSCSAEAKPLPLLLLLNQAAAVTAAVTTVAKAGAAAQTSRSQHERSKLQCLQQWQAELLDFGHS